VLAVNVGGALIPVALSLYLIVKHQLFGLHLSCSSILERGEATDEHVIRRTLRALW
jgi:uncharacterized membrane protein